MNYAELRQAVIDETHRSDLTADVPKFIKRAEDLIARRLRAAEMIAHGTITDADRVNPGEPVFALPEDFLEARALWVPSDGGTRERWVEQRSLSEIRRLPLTARVVWYAVSGDRIEFRGNPSDSLTIDIEYFARPAALEDDADTNALLNNHEELYLAGACFYLHRFTQDLELAQAHLDSFTDTVEGLNEQAGRHLGAPTVNPVYAFGPGPGGY